MLRNAKLLSETCSLICSLTRLRFPACSPALFSKLIIRMEDEKESRDKRDLWCPEPDAHTERVNQSKPVQQGRPHFTGRSLQNTGGVFDGALRH